MSRCNAALRGPDGPARRAAPGNGSAGTDCPGARSCRPPTVCGALAAVPSGSASALAADRSSAHCPGATRRLRSGSPASPAGPATGRSGPSRRSRARARDYRCGGVTADAGRGEQDHGAGAASAFVSRDILDPLDQAGPGQLVVVIAPPGVRKDDAVVVLGAQAGRSPHRVDGPGPALRRPGRHDPPARRRSRTHPEQIAVLVAGTEGVGDRAAVRRARAALRRYPQGFIAQFTGREEAVAGYLTSEVMTRLPAQSHQLLRVAAGVMSAAGKRGEADTTSPVWSGRAHACGGKRLLPAP